MYAYTFGDSNKNEFIHTHTHTHIYFSRDDNTFKCTSTTDAFYPPIVTTTQMNAMTVNEGAVVYNTTTNRLTVYIGSQWKDVGSDP